jgi:hypothetical protein
MELFGRVHGGWHGQAEADPGDQHARRLPEVEVQGSLCDASVQAAAPAFGSQHD